MGVFFILLLVPILLQHCMVTDFYIDYQKRNRFALGLFFFLLTVLVMFRHSSVGSDTRVYISYFEKYQLIKWENLDMVHLEIGYAYINKIISVFSEEPQFFLALVAIAVSAMIYPTYKRLNVDSSLTIVLFCIMSTFVMMFSGIRQMIAIGIGFVAYEFVRQKKVIPFLLSVCLATTFHTSAFILFLMYPIYHVKINRKWLYVVVPVLVGMYAFSETIFSTVGLIIAQYTKYDATISNTGAYTMLLLFIVFAVFSFIIPDENIIDEETVGLRNILLFALALQMFAPLHTLAMRMNYYYIIFIPLLLPKIIECRRDYWRQVAIIGRHVMVVFFLIYFFLNAYTSESNLHVFPYHFFWEDV